MGAITNNIGQVKGHTFAFLVRPRAGKERSFAISSLAHGACAHELVEQSVAGGRFSVNGKPVMGGQTLETAVNVVVAQLCRKHRCQRTMPVLVHGPTSP